jgi:hypothetical protein
MSCQDKLYLAAFCGFAIGMILAAFISEFIRK